MPISPGSKWGEEIVPPTAIRSFGSDRELGTALRDNSLNSQPQGALHLVSDDFRSLLGLKELTKRTTAIKIRIDALAISYTDKHGGTHQDVCIGSLHGPPPAHQNRCTHVGPKPRSPTAHSGAVFPQVPSGREHTRPPPPHRPVLAAVASSPACGATTRGRQGLH